MGSDFKPNIFRKYSDREKKFSLYYLYLSSKAGLEVGLSGLSDKSELWIVGLGPYSAFTLRLRFWVYPRTKSVESVPSLLLPGTILSSKLGRVS